MSDGAVLPFLAGAAVVCTLYGTFFMLFSTYMFLVLRVQCNHNGRVESPVYKTIPFIGSVLLFCTVTPHWILVVHQAFMAFVYYDNGSQASLYYAKMTTPPYLAAASLSAVTLVIGDCILIWRLALLWSHQLYVIVFPIIGVLAGIGSFAGVMYEESVYRVGNPGSLTRINSLMIVCYSGTLATNLYSCVLICWMLWRKSRVTFESQREGLCVITRVLVIFTESAVLYIVWILICLIASFTDPSAIPCLGEAVVPITGIAFMLFNVRITLGDSLGTQLSKAEPAIDSAGFRSEPITLMSIANDTGMNEVLEIK